MANENDSRTTIYRTESKILYGLLSIIAILLLGCLGIIWALLQNQISDIKDTQKQQWEILTSLKDKVTTTSDSVSDIKDGVDEVRTSEKGDSDKIEGLRKDLGRAFGELSDIRKHFKMKDPDDWSKKDRKQPIMAAKPIPREVDP